MASTRMAGRKWHQRISMEQSTDSQQDIYHSEEADRGLTPLGEAKGQMYVSGFQVGGFVMLNCFAC